MSLIAQKELCASWIDRPITAKTMRKERKRWGLRPADFDGLQPLFTPEDIERAKARRLQARTAKAA